MKIKNICPGNKVKDEISGLVGVSLVRCFYLNGCIQHEVQPLADKENNMDDTVWIDEKQLGGDMFIDSFNNIELGSKVECWLTGFTGIVVAFAQHFGGLIEYEVQPLVNNEGKRGKSRWICESRLTDLTEYSDDDDESDSSSSDKENVTDEDDFPSGGHRNHPS